MYNKDILGLDFVIFRIKHVFCLAYIIGEIFWIYFRSSFLFVISYVFFCIAVKLTPGLVAKALSKVIIQGFKLQEYFWISCKTFFQYDQLLSRYLALLWNKMLLKILFKKLYFFLEKIILLVSLIIGPDPLGSFWSIWFICCVHIQHHSLPHVQEFGFN